jgi:hypothetical protein
MALVEAMPAFIPVPGGTNLYFQNNPGSNLIQWSTDNTTFTDIPAIDMPVTIAEDGTYPEVYINVQFNGTADQPMRITNGNGSTKGYFVCGSTHINFGTKDGALQLGPSGELSYIQIENVINYPGLIQNGESIDGQGYGGVSNINVCNLLVSSSLATLASNSGWVCQRYFATNALANRVINCRSNGLISNNSGGIIGADVGDFNTEQPTELTIIGCSSSGDIGGSGAGGILGANSAIYSGDVVITITDCYSTGNIYQTGGGITGFKTGGATNITDPNNFTSNLTLKNCYSTGDILGDKAGGIVGSTAYGPLVSQCYSTGDISGNYTGGIFGHGAGDQANNAVAINCYSIGLISANSGGIFGFDLNVPLAVAQNCYTSGSSDISGNNGIFPGISNDNPTDGDGYNPLNANNYSEANNGNSGTWSTANATASHLLGTPTPLVPYPSGAVWTYDISGSVLTNSPFILASFGYTPYFREMIDASLNLVKVYELLSTEAGGFTNAAMIQTNHTFKIAAINGQNPTTFPVSFPFNESTGMLQVPPNTTPGTYTFLIYDKVNPYTTTEIQITVTGPPPEPTGSCCATAATYAHTDYNTITAFRVGNRLIAERAANPDMRFASHTDYVKYKMALGRK